jgi:hypothetical protein
MSTKKPRVIPISDDGELGKIIPGETFVEQYFPELLAKKPDVTTDPVGPVPDPPVIVAPKLVAGHPRTQVGSRLDKDKGVRYSIFVCTGMPDLIEVVSQPGQPDAYVPRGFNWGYESLPGVARPTGPETFWGLDPVPGSTRPAGYRTRYFEDGRAYYEQSDLPDEEEPRKPDAVQTAMNLQIQGHYEPSRS